MTMEETTSNSFAITLVYYYNYCRSKLTVEDLTKIKKKYERKPAQLLLDLQKKYLFPTPDKVTISQVQRVIGKFDIPTDYVSITKIPVCAYDECLDITDGAFDVEIALERKFIIASFKNCPMKDNMSKVHNLISDLLTDEERGRKPDSISSGTISKSAERRAFILAAKEKEKETRRPFFDRLAEASVPKYTFRNDSGVETVLASPLSLIHQFMQSKERVRIIVRRHAAVRGSLDAYVQGFDRFWNLFLTDVDEEFIFNKVTFYLTFKSDFGFLIL